MSTVAFAGPFALPYVQRGAFEVLLLAVAGGLIGTWIVLRGLAFFSHAVGTATFPGLVLADGVGFSAHLGAIGTAGLVAAAVAWLTRRTTERYDSATALVLVAALAVGVVLASDVFHSGSNIETLLFGSLLAIGPADLRWAAAAAVVVVALTVVLGSRWLATGFDADTTRAMGARSALPGVVLLAVVALVSVAAVAAVGALLATSMTVVPAATTRLLTKRMGSWQLASMALAAAQSLVGLWLSIELNAPPGAAIAVLGGVLFALAGAFVVWRDRPRTADSNPATVAA